MDKHSAYCFDEQFRNKFLSYLERKRFVVEGGFVKRKSIKEPVGELAGDYLVVYDDESLDEKSKRFRNAVSRLTEIAEAFEPFRTENP